MYFSVVVPAYRAADTLVKAVESALSQSHPAHEVIVVDDASPDDQLATLGGLFDQVHLVKRAVNGGEAAAKNSGVFAATGDWVVTLDADDSWEPDRLSALASFIETNPAVDIVTTDAWIESDGLRLRRYYGGPTGARWSAGDQPEDILERNFIFSHAAVRRVAWLSVGGMDESRRDCGADWPLWVRLILSGSRAGLVAEPLVHYALTPGSLSDSPALLARTGLAAMRAAIDHPQITSELRRTATENESAFARQLRRIDALDRVSGGARPRRELFTIAADAGYRKRHRLEAAIGVLSPAALRRRMERFSEASLRG